MDGYDELSEEAKQAWQRGFDLAYPRASLPASSHNGPEQDRANGYPVRATPAIDAIASALEDLGSINNKTAVAVQSGDGIQLVVMDPVSVDAVLVELDNMLSDECREALGEGFLRGMIAKAKAAKAEHHDDRHLTLN